MKYTKEQRLDIGRRIYDGEINKYDKQWRLSPVKLWRKHGVSVGGACSDV